MPVIFRTPLAVYAGVALGSATWAGLITSTQVLAYGIPKPENRAGHYTFYLMSMYGAGAFGPIIAGWMLDTLSYPVVFLAYAVFGLAMFPLGRLLLSILPNESKDYS